MNKEQVIRNRGVSPDGAQILVSVCCPTYNHAPYIRKALDGILMQQTDISIEILVRDDYSTDGTRAIVQEYASKHPDKVKAILEPENTFSKGVKPLPALLQRARGKYIAICEGDDEWVNPHKLAKQVAVMEGDPDIAICFHSAIEVDVTSGAKSIVCNPRNKDTQIPLSEIILGRGGFMPTASVMFRNYDIDTLVESYRNAPIGDLFIQVFAASRGRCQYINRPYSLYRRNTHGSWTLGQRNASARKEYRRRMLSALDNFFPYIRTSNDGSRLHEVYLYYANHLSRETGTRLDYTRSMISFIFRARHLSRCRLLAQFITTEFSNTFSRLLRKLLS